MSEQTRSENWLAQLRMRLRREESDGDNQFGTFAGVFVPTILTVLGAIMYLRLGWVTGNAGLLGALLIIVLAHLITFSTGLSVSSVATNTRVGAGGAFAIISQSLGIEIGGSVGVPLFLAQGVSVALYILAFAEALISLLPPDSGVTLWMISLAAFLVVFAIAYVSARFASRIQLLILLGIILSLVSIFLGGVVLAREGALIEAPVLWGPFSQANFWTTFAVFFPAVTGIMTGISMSGSLRDPRTSIPIGTMGAIVVGFIVYISLTFWLVNVATPEELLNNSTIMVNKALWGWAVYVGMLGATFSSALGSLVAAPRVMQALASKHVLPKSKFLAQEAPNGEPRNAALVTGLIALIALLWALSAGGINSVAQVITMFFLITYAMLNLVVLAEQQLQTVSFRPTLHVSRLVPFVGLVGCIIAMALVAPLFSLIAAILVLALYVVLTRRTLVDDRNDIRSGLFFSLAEWAAIRTSHMPSAPQRTWKPMVLAPVSDTSTLRGTYRFLHSLTWPQGGVHALGIYSSEEEKSHLKDLESLTEGFVNDGIYANATFLEEVDFVNGVRATTQVLRETFFRPNILLLRLRENSDLNKLQELVDKTAAYSMGILLLHNHPVNGMGREQIVTVWVSNQGPDWKPDLRLSNLDLALLVAYKLALNWNGRIVLCMAVDSDEVKVQAETYLQQLIILTRLPSDTIVQVFVLPFEKAIHAGPTTDLNIFGLAHEPDLHFIQRLALNVDTSCVFVRDSGEESALA
jgi:solute carrier family 12 sodium/potassium/chloride transporter 2